MAEILHQLIAGLPPYLQGFSTIPGGAGFPNHQQYQYKALDDVPFLEVYASMINKLPTSMNRFPSSTKIHLGNSRGFLVPIWATKKKIRTYFPLKYWFVYRDPYGWK